MFAFELAINRSFHDRLLFKYYKKESGYVVEVSPQVVKLSDSSFLGIPSSIIPDSELFELQESMSHKVNALLRSLLEYKQSDDVCGLDGSAWILKFVSSSDSHELNYWTPSYNTEVRDIQELYRLGEMFWVFTGGENKYGELY